MRLKHYQATFTGDTYNDFFAGRSNIFLQDCIEPEQLEYQSLHTRKQMVLITRASIRTCLFFFAADKPLKLSLRSAGSLTGKLKRLCNFLSKNGKMYIYIVVKQVA